MAAKCVAELDSKKKGSYMRCTSPRTVGFHADGKTLCWSPKKYSKEYATFQLPCGKCISCRLEYARQTAIRCVHEASMHKHNCFLTLTYNQENLGTNRLTYGHIQQFQKVVRNYRYQVLLDSMFPTLPQKEQRTQWNSLPKERKKELYDKIKISFFTAGEYGPQTKRAHWHLLIFNWSPEDKIPKYTTERGDKIYSSAIMGKLWTFGNVEIGSVTFESAGYCARYSAKKLVHGKDNEHDYQPIARRSSRNAIGKTWIQKNWRDCFENGYLVFNKGGEYIQCGIPRYYEKWLQKYLPLEWEKYITKVKQKNMDKIQEKETKLYEQEKLINSKRIGLKGPQIKRSEQENKILESKFKELQKTQKF